MFGMALIETALIEIPAGLLYGNAMEWLIHKYLLHGLGKNKSSFWSFHWHDHHRNARRKDMVDEDYQKPIKLAEPPGKELVSLILAALAHAPLFFIAPFFTLTVWYCAFNYHRVHKKSHLDPEWARENMPWHVDHHMGPDQDQNWCVTKPWFDIIMGTRVRYVGTQHEEQSREKRRRLRDSREKGSQANANASVS